MEEMPQLFFVIQVQVIVLVVWRLSNEITVLYL